MIFYKHGTTFGQGYVLPQGAKKITEAEYTKGIQPKPPEMDLEEALVAVARGAETAYSRYLPQGAGRLAAHAAKAEELRRYDKDTSPVKQDYPFLSAEIGITGDSLSAVADAVRKAIGADEKTWLEKGPKIERTRRKALSDLAKAETPDRIQNIVHSIEWP